MPDSIPTPPASSEVPRHVDRETGAELVRKHFGFRVAPRSLQGWPVVWLRVNGRAVCETAQLFVAAQAKLDAAMQSRGGKATAAEPDAELVSPHGATTGRPPAVGCPA